MKYGVQFEESSNGVGAYLPDVPGVAVVGETIDEALSLLGTALQWHIDALMEDEAPLPLATVDESNYDWFLIPRLFNVVLSDAVRHYVTKQNDAASLWHAQGVNRLRYVTPALELQS